ncbi:MAG: hypothetical protein B7Z11_02575, partial [Acidovorax sp. 32-64-7]
NGQNIIEITFNKDDSINKVFYYNEQNAKSLKLIEEYTADGVRVGLLLSSAAGNDLLFDESLCQQGKGAHRAQRLVQLPLEPDF